MTSSDTPFARLSQRSGALYTLPAVAMKVLELTGSDQVDTQSLKEHLENDPALCVKLLRVVNSSLFGLSRSVDDLNQALALLGTKPLKLLVLGFSLPEELLEGGPAEALAGYWRLALTKAVAARQASEMLWECPGDDAFLASLLEDIGMLVMVRELGDPYHKFLARVAETDADLRQLEHDSLGFDHVELSANLLEQWHLPESLVAAISRPRSLIGLAKLPDGESFLPQVTHLADLIAQLVVENRLRVLPDLIECGQRFCGLTKTKLTELIVCLEEKVDSLADVLSLELPTGMEYTDVLRMAHEQLAHVAADAAGSLIGQREREAANEQQLLDEASELAAATKRLVSEPIEHFAPSPEETGDDFHSHQSLESDPDNRMALTATDTTCQTALAEREVLNQKLRADLVQRLAVAVAACRQRRCELSLLVAGSEEREVSDDPESTRQAEIRGSHTPAPRSPNPEILATDSRSAEPGIDHPLAETWLLSKSRFAVILLGCDREEAVRQAQQLLRRLNGTGEQIDSDGTSSKTWSVGTSTVPVAPKNFDPESLLDSAERCLYGANSGGGGTVKSIEIC